MKELAEHLQTPMINLLLSIADDKLFLGHRNSDWTGIAPILEADIAFSSLAQDDIAHASAIYELINTINGQDPDQIAFGRTADEYLSASIVSTSDSFNWAAAIARQFFCNHFDYIRLQRLSACEWEPLASLAKRLTTEQAIHVEHVSSWVVHLGNGNEDSANRMQEAIDVYAPLAAMLFEKPEGFNTLVADGVLHQPDDFFATWKQSIDDVVSSAGLTLHLNQIQDGFIGGRSGQHDEDFSSSLTELHAVFNEDPAAKW